MCSLYPKLKTYVIYFCADRFAVKSSLPSVCAHFPNSINNASLLHLTMFEVSTYTISTRKLLLCLRELSHMHTDTHLNLLLTGDVRYCMLHSFCMLNVIIRGAAAPVDSYTLVSRVNWELDRICISSIHLSTPSVCVCVCMCSAIVLLNER